MDLKLTYVRRDDGTRTLTIPEDRRQFVISYVREGARKTPAEIEATVQEGHDAISAALDGVSETQAAHKPSAEDWSVLELMAHVVTTKQIMGVLCTHLAQGQLPPRFGPQLEEERAQDGITVAKFATLAEARAASDAAHGALLDVVRGFGPATDDEMRFRHFLFGAFNAREWAVFQRIHDEDHTPQLHAIKSSAAYPATSNPASPP